MSASTARAQKKQKWYANERVTLGRVGETTLYLVYTPQPWILPVEAFTIPVGPELDFSGGLASALREHLGPKLDEDFRQLMAHARSLHPGFKPETPLLIELSGQIRSLLGPANAFAATAFAPEASASNAAAAAAAVVKLASTRGLRRIALSLLGSGAGGLDSLQVIRAMLETILAPGILNGLDELTFTTLSEKVMHNRGVLSGMVSPLHPSKEPPEEPDESQEPPTPEPRHETPPGRALFDSDQQTKRDCLDIDTQAETFARLIMARDVTAPLSLGLFGNWGTGKTFFMETLKQKIHALQKKQPTASLAKNENGTYVDRVAQIWFNAWHYVDSNLWASLATRIFDGLTRELFPGAKPHEYEKHRRELRSSIDSNQRSLQEAERRQLKAKEERREAAEKLATQQAHRKRSLATFDSLRLKRLLASVEVKSQADKVREAAEKFGVSPVLKTAEDTVHLWGQLRALDGRIHGLLVALGAHFSGAPRALVTLLVIAGFFVGAALLPTLLAAIKPELIESELLTRALQLSVVMGGGLTWAGKRLHLLAQGLSALDNIRAALAAQEPAPEQTEEGRLRREIESADAEIQEATEQMNQADRRIAEAQAELQRINAGGLVYDFLGGRIQDPRYTQSLGLISVIRQDFEKLGELLEDWAKNQQNQSSVDRIILYIDDLDRCHPDRVVEVLQAVHLLLAFDLFIVVVGVDARWLERSLYKAYVLDSRTDSGEQSTRDDFNPQNYLEKIFQVPFSLTEMAQTGFENLVNALTNSPASPPTPRPTSEEVNRPAPPPDSLMKNGSDTSVRIPPPERPAPEPQTDKTRDEGLHLRSWEQTCLRSLHPFITTPRLTKRLINIYRLLRVRATARDFDFARFIDEREGEYKAALLLLALNIGHPLIGGRLLRLLPKAPADISLPQFIGAFLMDVPSNPAWAGEWLRTAEEMRELRELSARIARLEKSTLLGNLAPYKMWATEVGRYSFDWNLS